MAEVLILPSGRPALAEERRMIIQNAYALPKLASQVEEDVAFAMWKKINKIKVGL